jgi:hypothetical protein
MLKRAITLAMSITADLMIVIGSIAVGSSKGTNIIGLALFAIGFGVALKLWRRVPPMTSPAVS